MAGGDGERAVTKDWDSPRPQAAGGHSDKFAAVEIRPCTTEDGGAGLYAFIGGKMLGQVLTDDSGHVLVRLSRRALVNGLKSPFPAVTLGTGVKLEGKV